MRPLSALLVALALASLIAACGGDDDEEEAARAVLAAFELTGSGENVKMSGPSLSRPGSCGSASRTPPREMMTTAPSSCE
jgi:hypothetical protein